ncbi:hypothetical protein DEU56DRAFT_759367 [Suillus clintonianus]|uniref:uncharacterized protein n=1 Tax=Suillus clintonianus TaxID=1904413 RepID=UPI001B868C6C|nr:uncharacterized protein DEU56DRAFT_759367 [Suillus clintonianus]KAG2125337.1 hypothetical protein DEU56DRAFT_759367 [Suillus clintonianus]
MVYAYLYDHETKNTQGGLPVLHRTSSRFNLRFQHPFAGFKGRRFVVVGYIALYGQVSALYCDQSVVEQSPWLEVLNVVGVLTVPDNFNVDHDHPLFEVTRGDSYFLVETPYGRPNILGKPGKMWFLSQLLQASIPFNPPLSSNEFSHPANPAFEDNPYTHELSRCAVDEPMASTSGHSMPSTHLATDQPPPPAPLADTDDAYILDTLLGLAPHAPFSVQSSTMMHLLDDGSIDWPALDLHTGGLRELNPSEELGEVVTGEPAPINSLDLHPDLKWRDSEYLWGKLEAHDKTKILRLLGRKICCWYRVIKLTQALILGSLWVGMYGNPFKISDVDERMVITSSFLTALRIDGKTYIDLREQPLILKNGKKRTSVGWRIIRTHLLSLFDNTKSELRKVVKGVMSPITGFCAKGERKETIKQILSVLNSGDTQAVQEALAKLVVHQLFRELFWMALLIPVDRLADEKRSARIADLFPEELCASVGCVALDTVANLLTLIYHTMLLILREGPDKVSITSYKKHEVMHEIIISALAPMYANPDQYPKFTEAIMSLPFMMYEHVLDINPKNKSPRTNGKDKKGRVMEDVVKIISITEPNDVPRRGGLPNNQGFSCFTRNGHWNIKTVCVNIARCTARSCSPAGPDQ